RLAAEEADGLDVRLDLLGGRGGQRERVGVRREQGRCRQVHAHVGGLGGEEGGDEALERRGEVELAARVGVEAFQLLEDQRGALALPRLRLAQGDGHGWHANRCRYGLRLAVRG